MQAAAGAPDPFSAPAGATVEQIAALAQANRCKCALISRHPFPVPSSPFLRMGE